MYSTIYLRKSESVNFSKLSGAFLKNHYDTSWEIDSAMMVSHFFWHLHEEEWKQTNKKQTNKQTNKETKNQRKSITLKLNINKVIGHRILLKVFLAKTNWFPINWWIDVINWFLSKVLIFFILNLFCFYQIEILTERLHLTNPKTHMVVLLWYYCPRGVWGEEKQARWKQINTLRK